MSTDSRLLRALKALFPIVFPREPFLGPRRYRVVSMKPSASSIALTRVELQIVQKASGMPDLLTVSYWPGAAGFSAELTPGAICLVDFIDGDRGQPRIAAFSTPDDPAWRPLSMRLDAVTAIQLGADGAPAAARVGDSVDMGKISVVTVGGGATTITWIPPTPPHTPVLITSTPTQLDALVSTGSSKTVIE